MAPAGHLPAPASGARVITRFAPSPTGPLHLGHAWAAFVAWRLARQAGAPEAARTDDQAGGQFLLRIEDIDRQRSKPEWEAALLEDLDWLGLTPDGAVLRQSGRMLAYQDALDQLWRLGLLYPCSCTRRDIGAALSAPQEGAPLLGPDGLIYPGLCRPGPGAPVPTAARPDGAHVCTTARPDGAHLRLNMRRALDYLAARGTDELSFTETGHGPGGETGSIRISPQHLVQGIGDVVVARRDFGTSYHLAVVVDDAAQGVTLVSRGEDLFEATPIHILLQQLLGLPRPAYHHHALVRDGAGKRLAKRDDAQAISLFRASGMSAADVLALAEAGTRPAQR